MTIKRLYPNQRPAQLYNVINGPRELTRGSVFSRVGTANYTDSAGVVRAVAEDEPRFNYFNNSFVGLVVNPMTDNLFKYSNNYDGNDGPWWSLNYGSNRGTITSTTEPAPDLTNTASILVRTPGTGSGNLGLYYIQAASGFQLQTQSVYVKKMPGSSVNEVTLVPINGGSTPDGVTVNLDTGEFVRGITIEEGSNYGVLSSDCQKLANGWYRLTITATPFANYADTFYLYSKAGGGTNPEGDGFLVWGAMSNIGYAVEYISSDGSPGSTQEEFLSISATTNNYDFGLSLLLDSETTTQDVIYQINAGGTEVASLTNNGGTLNWEIDGVSAQTRGDYPQVGFLPGRVRTVSSFGPADGQEQENYLYTTGISFPTKAVVAAGADEIVFGKPLTLKALYIWDGQLDQTNAVSLIRGQYNVVPSVPIETDAYSFVYNTDPINENNKTITLPYIVPTVGMTVDWGDGNSNAYEQGVTASHTYPYPGQYRIQITADDGFDSVRLSDVFNTIYLVDQYAPQHRVGATGPGFTGDDLENMFNQQDPLKEIPPFKYSGLTDLYQAFFATRKTKWNNWDWVPVDMPEVTTLYRTFGSVGSLGPDSEDAAMAGSFPQLQTTNKLTDVYQCFNATPISGFKKDGVSVPAFSDSSGITRWDYCFGTTNVTEIFDQYDYSSAVTFEYTWVNNKATSFPSITLPDSVTSLRGAWSNSDLTSFPSNINTKNVDNVIDAWRQTKITVFPTLSLNNVIRAESAWYGSPIVSFPNIPLPNVARIDSAWFSCNKMTSWNVTQLNTTGAFSAPQAWMNCALLASFPNIDTSQCRTFKQAWRNCTSLVSFPSLDLSYCNDASYAWNNCQFPVFPSLLNTGNVTRWEIAFSRNNEMTEFKPQDFANATTFFRSWEQNGKLATFPASQFTNTGKLDTDAFEEAFIGCALTPASIENIIVSLRANAAKGINTNVLLDISGGTNAPRYAGSSGTTSDSTSWSANCLGKFDDLISFGWTIVYNKYAGEIVTDTFSASPQYCVFHGPNGQQFVETSASVESGLPSKESFTDEGEAIARVLELNESFFPAWDMDEIYSPGARVKFGKAIFRALQENDARSFDLPEEFDLDQEIPTPINRQARWAMVCDPEFEENFNEEESY